MIRANVKKNAIVNREAKWLGNKQNIKECACFKCFVWFVVQAVFVRIVLFRLVKQTTTWFLDVSGSFSYWTAEFMTATS